MVCILEAAMIKKKNPRPRLRRRAQPAGLGNKATFSCQALSCPSQAGIL